mmetsp:Transcript_7150/g.10389  ORF Transcript_7150/g.10389 Transcript_7150/m.10389 type:complete len:109 (+) Transcript_7150:121-447(+)
MCLNDLRFPAIPASALRETNRETLERLEHDLTLIGNNQLSAADSYRLLGHDELERPFWGYGVEAARMENSRDILVLMRSDELATVEKHCDGCHCRNFIQGSRLYCSTM